MTGEIHPIFAHGDITHDLQKIPKQERYNTALSIMKGYWLAAKAGITSPVITGGSVKAAFHTLKEWGNVPDYVFNQQADILLDDSIKAWPFSDVNKTTNAELEQPNKKGAQVCISGTRGELNITATGGGAQVCISDKGGNVQSMNSNNSNRRRERGYYQDDH